MASFPSLHSHSLLPHLQPSIRKDGFRQSSLARNAELQQWLPKSSSANLLSPFGSEIAFPDRKNHGLSCSRRHLLPILAMSAFVSSAARADAASSAVETEAGVSPKVVFVAGATGNTGKRIVNLLLEKNIKVKAGVRSLEKARATFPSNPNLEFVIADVTSGADRLAESIKGSDALICATGFTPGLDPTNSWKVDYFGTVALVDASKRVGVDRFVLVTSLLTNAAAWGQAFNSAYLFLNLFGLVLIAKLQAELYLRKSGLDYTIIRPGGLRNTPPSGQILMTKEDTLYEGSISRDSVALVAVEALFEKEASMKVVEIISLPDAKPKSFKELFASV